MEELECSYLSDVELISASQNVEDRPTLKVGDSKNVIVFDPLHMGHVIQRIRSGRVRIFNGNQRETLYLINQERIGFGSSNLVARLVA